MDLSVSLFIAASFAILCTVYIGKRILTIDLSEYCSKNSEKAKLERLLAKKETPLQNSKIRRDIRKAFEKILIPLFRKKESLTVIFLSKRNVRAAEQTFCPTKTAAAHIAVISFVKTEQSGKLKAKAS